MVSLWQREVLIPPSPGVGERARDGGSRRIVREYARRGRGGHRHGHSSRAPWIRAPLAPNWPPWRGARPSGGQDPAPRGSFARGPGRRGDRVSRRAPRTGALRGARPRRRRDRCGPRPRRRSLSPGAPARGRGCRRPRRCARRSSRGGPRTGHALEIEDVARREGPVRERERGVDAVAPRERGVASVVEEEDVGVGDGFAGRRRAWRPRLRAR